VECDGVLDLWHQHWAVWASVHTRSFEIACRLYIIRSAHEIHLSGRVGHDTQPLALNLGAQAVVACCCSPPFREMARPLKPSWLRQLPRVLSRRERDKQGIAEPASMLVESGLVHSAGRDDRSGELGMEAATAV